MRPPPTGPVPVKPGRVSHWSPFVCLVAVVISGSGDTAPFKRAVSSPVGGGRGGQRADAPHGPLKVLQAKEGNVARPSPDSPALKTPAVGFNSPSVAVSRAPPNTAALTSQIRRNLQAPWPPAHCPRRVYSRCFKLARARSQDRALAGTTRLWVSSGRSGAPAPLTGMPTSCRHPPTAPPTPRVGRKVRARAADLLDGSFWGPLPVLCHPGSQSREVFSSPGRFGPDVGRGDLVSQHACPPG